MSWSIPRLAYINLMKCLRMACPWCLLMRGNDPATISNLSLPQTLVTFWWKEIYSVRSEITQSFYFIINSYKNLPIEKIRNVKYLINQSFSDLPHLLLLHLHTQSLAHTHTITHIHSLAHTRTITHIHSLAHTHHHTQTFTSTHTPSHTIIH